MIALPILSVLGLYVLIYCHKNEINRKQEAMIYSIICNAVYCFVITEVLSQFLALTNTAVAICWLGALILIAALIVIGLKKDRVEIAFMRKAFVPSKKPKMSLLVVNYVILVVVGIIAVMTKPYNWDSMSYHFSRLIHWILNKSVAHYACFDFSQITDPNLGEFIFLQIYLLTNGCDRICNLVQFSSFAVSAVVVRDICMKIGGSKRTGNVAMLMYMSTPIVFTEALTTQVDHVSAVFMLIFVWMGLEFVGGQKLALDKSSVIRLVLMGCSAGLTYNAKAHSCIAIFVFALWIVIACIKNRDKIIDIVRATLLVIVPALVIVLPEMIRNLYTFGSLTADEITSSFLINSLDPRYYFINCVENFAFNMNNTIAFNEELFLKIIYKLRLICLGELTPPLLNEFQFTVDPMTFNHDNAINPLVTWLTVVSIIILVIRFIIGLFKKGCRLKLKDREGYIIFAFASIILFFAIAKWYAFITRYEVGYFAIVIPAVAICLQKVDERFVLCDKVTGKFCDCCIQLIVSVICFVTLAEMMNHCVQYTQSCSNQYREYFRVRDNLYEDYCDTTDYVLQQKCDNVGFMCGNDSYEYPLYKMMEGRISTFQHVNVDNETAVYEDKQYHPDCIIVVDRTVEPELECNGTQYYLAEEFGVVQVFEER